MSKWKAYYSDVDGPTNLKDYPQTINNVEIDPNTVIEDTFRLLYNFGSSSRTAFFLVTNGKYKCSMKVDTLVEALKKEKTFVYEDEVYIRGEFKLCKKGTTIFLKLL